MIESPAELLTTASGDERSGGQGARATTLRPRAQPAALLEAAGGNARESARPGHVYCAECDAHNHTLEESAR